MDAAEREAWRQADRVLDGVLDLPPEQRAARLAALEMPASLRLRVQRLLAAHGHTGPLEQPPPLPDIATTANIGGGLRGRRLGRWRLQEEIGRGGMAVIYRAVAEDGMAGQVAALKVLTLAHMAHHGRDRFLQEQQALLRVRHPYIATLYDAGVADDGTPWLAMALVEGEPIDGWCERRELDIAARVRLALQVCEAVSHAHRNLVIHRDIKPSNVLVDGDSRVRLLDFGIARPADERDAEPTATAHRALTPEYAAPEQFVGGPVTTAIDVYGIGALLYRLLSGVAPRASGAPDATPTERPPSRAAAVYPALSPSLRKRVARCVRGDLDVIVMKALATEPDARYASVEALATDLKRWLDGMPVRAQAPNLRYRARRFVARHKLALVAGALVALASLGGIAATLWQAGIARNQAARAQLAADESQAQLEYLHSVLDVLAPGTEATREMDRQEMIAEAARRAQRDLAGRESLLARVELGLGDIARRVGSYQQAHALFTDALRLRKATHGVDSLEYGEALMNLGAVTDLLAPPDPVLAETRLRQAVELLQRHHAKPQLLVRALNEHANKLANLGRYQDARDVLGTATGHCSGTLRQSESCDQVWKTLGELERREGHFGDAIAAYRKLLALRRERLGKDHARTAVAYARLGHALVRAGEHARGLRLLEHARELNQRTNATPTGESLQILCDLAEAYLVVNRIDQARALLEQYLSAVRDLFGERSVEFAYGLSRIGSAHHRSGHFADAADAYRRSHAIYLDLLGERTPPAAYTLGRYADALRRQGRHAQALEAAKRSLAIHRELFGERSARTGVRWSHLGDVLLELGRPDPALEAYTRAADIFASSSTIDRQRAFVNRSQRGAALFALGRREAGLSEARAAIADAHASGIRHSTSFFYAAILANLVELACRAGSADECVRLQHRARDDLQADISRSARLKLEHALATTAE